MPPPPPPASHASSVASRLFLGPALRTQSDRRLVSLVREGYELAFEEIVRRYAKQLGRFAAAIVPLHRADDVTQDAFSKALLALRDTDKEIELRPWLYRIVRNTALNDLRDQPPPAEGLHENIHDFESPAEAAERREEIADLMHRLGSLPEPQRAAIVMRELEGLSHEEIASALGMTGGAARQTIFRARRALRDGVGLLIPTPVLQFLLASTLGGAAAGVGVGTGAAGGIGAASAGGAGATLKAGLATFFVAGSVAAGVALHERSHDGGGPTAEATASAAEPGANSDARQQSGVSQGDSPGSSNSGSGQAVGSGSEGDNSGPGGDRSAETSGPGGDLHSGPGGDDSHSGPGGGGGTRPQPGPGEGPVGEHEGPGGGLPPPPDDGIADPLSTEGPSSFNSGPDTFRSSEFDRSGPG